MSTYFYVDWMDILGDGETEPVEVIGTGYATFHSKAWADRWIVTERARNPLRVFDGPHVAETEF